MTNINSIHSNTTVSKNVVAAVVIGNALEFYDFLIYGIFAVYIGKAFFPSDGAYVSLLYAVAVFGVGFLTRPLGGVLIGAYADRVGRKPALMLTIALITFGTLALAMTPTYDVLGWWAPAIVVMARLIQGLGLGGEVGPSSSVLVEISPKHKRGLYGSWQFSSQGLAIMVAGIVGVVLSMTLIPDDLQDWGWRIAFALGMILVPVAFYLRRYLPETLPKITDSAAKLPQAQLRHYTKELVLAILVTAGGAVSTYVALFMTSFAIATLKMPATISLSATIIVGVAIFSFSLVGGWLSDKYGRRNVIFVSRILLILVSIPAFMWLINAKTPEVLFIVAFTISALSTLSSAPLLVAVLELFPIRVRALGLSIAYAVGVSIFGGTTQFIITWLLKSTESLYSPAWYMMATSLVTLIAAYYLPDLRNRALDD